MARSYIVSNIAISPDDGLMEGMTWSYGDPLEQFNASGTHKLSDDARQDPTGLTQEDLVNILVADLPNTTEEFDATIDASIEQQAAKDELEVEPAPDIPVYITAKVIDATAPSNNFKWDDINDPTFVSLEVGAKIVSSDGIDAGATCLSKEAGTGVTTWDQSTTVSGTDVEFTIVYENPVAAPAGFKRPKKAL